MTKENVRKANISYHSAYLNRIMKNNPISALKTWRESISYYGVSLKKQEINHSWI